MVKDRPQLGFLNRHRPARGPELIYVERLLKEQKGQVQQNCVAWETVNMLWKLDYIKKQLTNNMIFFH